MVNTLCISILTNIKAGEEDRNKMRRMFVKKGTWNYEEGREREREREKEERERERVLEGREERGNNDVAVLPRAGWRYALVEMEGERVDRASRHDPHGHLDIGSAL